MTPPEADVVTLNWSASDGAVSPGMPAGLEVARFHLRAAPGLERFDGCLRWSWDTMRERMAAGVSLYWRLFATGISLPVFGAGGLVLKTLVFPLQKLMVRNSDHRVAAARTLIRCAFRTYIELMRVLGCCASKYAVWSGSNAAAC
jgi:hypothetical protein